MLTSQQNRYPIRTLGDSLTLRIIFTSILIFVCYFTIGLQLAVVPSFVHLQLGYNAVLAGLAISAQYVATLLSRPIAGRISDSVGAKHTTRSGLLVCATSCVFFLLSALSPRLADFFGLRVSERFQCNREKVWPSGKCLERFSRTD